MQPFLLGEWLVRPAENRLFGPLGERRLEPRVMQLLCRLAEADANTVRRAALLNELWWEKEVGDEVLSTAVSSLRKALGDDFRSPRYLETVPKAGYRLVQRPRAVGDKRPLASPADITTEPLAGQESEARWLYRMGRYHFERRSADSLRLCLELFEQAVEADPAFAPARAWLALVCQFMPLYSLDSDPGFTRRARDLALSALGLDRNEPIAHLVMGNESARQLRWVEADGYFQAALRNGPAEAPVHAAYAEFLSRLGHVGQAVEHARRAFELNSTSSGDNLILGWMLLHENDHDQVLRHASLAEQLGARAVFVDNLKGFVCHRQGWDEEAVALWRRLQRRNADEPRWMWPEPVVNCIMDQGNLAHARRHIESVSAATAEGNGIAYFLSALINRPDDAMSYAEHALADGSLLVVDPWLPESRCARSDPRFESVAESLGLAAAWTTLGKAELYP